MAKYPLGSTALNHHSVCTIPPFLLAIAWRDQQALLVCYCTTTESALTLQNNIHMT